jgi:glycosyltransferase involved in cell wall biosynthesis
LNSLMNRGIGDMRVVAIMPALNESRTIRDVVRAVRSFAEVVVVDDGSTDETASLAREAGADVVSHKINRGYDQALETGLRRAISLGFDYAVTMDADAQHSPAPIQSFIEEFMTGADVVVGIRGRTQRWAESLFALAARKAWGIRDPLCGMKGYRLALVEKAGYFDSYKSIGTEFTIRAARSGCIIRQVPVINVTRPGTSRFGSGLRANLKIFRALCLGFVCARPFPRP